MNIKETAKGTIATLAIDNAFLQAIDHAAATDFLNRSSWMRRAFARELERSGHLPSHIRVGRRQANSVQLVV